MISAAEMRTRYEAAQALREAEAKAEFERTREAREAAEEEERKRRTPPQRPMSEWLALADRRTQDLPDMLTSTRMDVTDQPTAEAVAKELQKAGYSAYTSKAYHHGVSWSWAPPRGSGGGDSVTYQMSRGLLWKGDGPDPWAPRRPA